MWWPARRVGRAPGRATLAPFAQATFARRAAATDIPHPTGVYPSAGIALQPFFDLLRLELARGLRHGVWTFNVDLSRDFWDILAESTRRRDVGAAADVPPA